MKALRLYLVLLLIVSANDSSAQVKIRLYANQNTGSALFTVNKGEYRITSGTGNPIKITAGDNLLISLFDGKVVLKKQNEKGILCDSTFLEGVAGDDSFFLRINGKTPLRQSYSGDLKCIPDIGTLLFINDCDIEAYIAGVVRAEGGSGKSIEYCKTQAVIVRTYLYRYFDKHEKDRYNLCDNTHCQAFNGITSDSVIIRAARETKDEVILGPDSTLIISAFHSNCGGETSPSEYVWLAGQSYLKKVTDPYCKSSRNATWQRSISLNDWVVCLKKNGFEGEGNDRALLNFSQPARKGSYSVGSFSIPLRQLRTDLSLRSTFFSVTVAGDTLLLKGKGYGHGVGLCQEGAMVMAQKGFDYKKIIGFYYTGVFVSDIKNAKISPPTPPAARDRL